ncbi:hypothetical protein GHT06_017007 [Daphnia sinensis]|uniref:Uncharacterized protein n=1 Tax=Daphnia sinensis TaxID=1820382 RepID=A0AAD5L8D9_9CRUS|nr:hypothetical protein GHT06_017007 [Daphnia sinensis]
MVLSLRRFTPYCLLQQVDKGVWLIDPPSGRDQHIIRDGDIGGRYNCNTLVEFGRESCNHANGP